MFSAFTRGQVHFEAAQIEERLASVCAKEVSEGDFFPAVDAGVYS